MNINSELNTISTEIYGEEIRGAIHSALQKLASGSSGGGGAGTANYNDLNNKPKINGVVLEGNKTSGDLGISGGGGTTNYNELLNKPKINNVPLEGNVSLDALGISIGSGSGLSVKGYLPDNSDLDIYADTPYGSYTGIYVIDHDLTYLNKPANFNDNGILININCNDGDVSNYEYGMYVQILYPQDFLGTYWVRTGRDSGWKEFNVGSGSGSGSGATVDANTIYPIIKSYINANTRPGNTESDLYNFVANLGRELHYMGNIGASAILNTYNTRNHFGVYYIPSANVTSGNLKSQLPEDYDDSLNGIFIVTYIGTRFRQELSYLATGSTDTSKASAKWHRDYNSSSWSPWISDGASQSQVESIVNTYLAGNDAVAEAAGTAAQNYINTNGSSTIYPIITNYIQDYDGANPSNTALKTAVEGWIAAAGTGTSGGTTNYGDLSNKPKINNVELSGGNNTFDSLGVITTVKGLIEGYVDKDNNTNSTGKNKFNAAVDARIAAAGGSGSGGTVDKNSVYSIIEDYIAENTAATPTKTALKSAVYSWDKKHEYIDSNSNGVLDAAFTNTKNYLYKDGDPSIEAAFDLYKSHLGDANRCMIADGIMGFAAFKRTEWFPTPQMYGAKANGDSSNPNDDTSAIQAAINANKGKTVYFPAGTYVITDTIRVGWADPSNTSSFSSAAWDGWYTNLIFDPGAVIKAGGDPNNSNYSGPKWSGTKSGPKTMIAIGPDSYKAQVKSKGRKKIFRGGVFDSNRQYVSVMIRVSQNVLDFDIADTTIRATNATTGLAIGHNSWNYNGAFQEVSMDAYVHHMVISKYAWSLDELPKPEKESDTVNRASGIVIYSNDNNFENIRINYFKRQVKITHGGGQYFSEIHTLGLRKSQNADTNPQYSDQFPATDGHYATTVYYDENTSGFHFENKTEVSIDKCYVDSDSYFVYVTPEAAGSRITVSQSMFLQYKEANRTMQAFYLGSNNYLTSNATGYGEVTNLRVDQFTMVPKSLDANINSDDGRHQGIVISPKMDDGGYFSHQVHNFNMSLERIRILGAKKLKAGDLLRGATGGEKGSVLFRPTPLAVSSGNSNYTKWYKLCSIPVAEGSKGKISYKVTIYFTGYYLTFPLAIYKFATVSNNKHLAIGVAGSTSALKMDSNDNKSVYEIGFTYESGTTLPPAYTMWLRMIGTSESRTIDRIVFDSATAITPSACNPNNDGYDYLVASDTTPSFVGFNDSLYKILYFNCTGDSFQYKTSPTT